MKIGKPIKVEFYTKEGERIAFKPSRKRSKKVWSTKYADKKFHDFLLKRDMVCQRCKKICGRLEVSHFFSRNNSATRYDSENCDIVGFPCHWGNVQGWEFKKQTEYRDFKIKQLGKERYDALCKRAELIVKREKAIREFMSI